MEKFLLPKSLQIKNAPLSRFSFFKMINCLYKKCCCLGSGDLISLCKFCDELFEFRLLDYLNLGCWIICFVKFVTVF